MILLNCANLNIFLFLSFSIHQPESKIGGNSLGGRDGVTLCLIANRGCLWTHLWRRGQKKCPPGVLCCPVMQHEKQLEKMQQLDDMSWRIGQRPSGGWELADDKIREKTGASHRHTAQRVNNHQGSKIKGTGHIILTLFQFDKLHSYLIPVYCMQVATQTAHLCPSPMETCWGWTRADFQLWS